MPDLNAWYQIAGIVSAVVIAAGWLLDRRRTRKREAIERARADAVAAAEKATIAAELAARLDAQDAVLKTLSDGFSRQFGTNGFVLHERQRALEADLSVVRDGLSAHVAQHVDRSFDR